MKRILITGCAGFIGFHLSQRFLREGFNVIGLDNLNGNPTSDFRTERLSILLNDKNIRGEFSFHKIDLSVAKKVNRLIKDLHLDLVLHMAAKTGVRDSLSEPSPYLSSNIVGFCNLMEACKVRKTAVIFASSSSVYGDSAEIPFKENAHTDHPISLYAATKKADEVMASYYAKVFDMQITGLRFFTVYGPWNRKDMAIYMFIKSIMEGTPVKLFNLGKMLRDFTYVEDVCESIFRLANVQTLKGGERSNFGVYNLGFGKPVDLKSLISLLESEIGKKAIIEYLPLQPGDMVETWADNSALARLINYTPQTNIKSGIRKTVEWVKGN